MMSAWELYHFIHDYPKFKGNPTEIVELEILNTFCVSDISSMACYHSKNLDILRPPKNLWKMDENFVRRSAFQT